MILQCLKYKTFYPFVLAAAVLAIGFYRLTESPPVWYDEGIYFQMAANFANFFHWGLQTAPGQFVSAAQVTVGYPALLPIGLIFKIFGVSLLAGRAVMVFFMAGTALAAYYLIKNQYGYKIAVASSSLLVVFPVFYGNGKNILGEVPGLFYLLLFLIFLRRIEAGREKNSLNYIAAGLFGGLCVATKPTFIVLIPAFAVVVFFWRKRINFQIKTAVLFGASFIAPIVLWIITQFGLGSSLGAMLYFFYNPYAIQNMNAVLWQNFRRFFTEPSAIYFFGLFLVWGFSILARPVRGGASNGARWKNKTALTLAETTAFVFSFLIALAYLRTFGWYRYFFPANLLALVYFPSSARRLISFVLYGKNITIKYSKIAVGGLIILLAAMHIYQLKYSSWVASYYDSRRSRELSEYFNTLPKQSSVYIYNAPAALIFLGHNNYYQYLNPAPGKFIGKETIDIIKRGAPDFIVLAAGGFENKDSLFDLYKIKDEVIDKYVVLEKITKL